MKMSIEPVKKIDDLVVVRNVIISVSDKSGLDPFVPELVETNPDVCWYSNNSGINNSSAISMGNNFTLIGMEGINNLTLLFEF